MIRQPRTPREWHLLHTWRRLDNPTPQPVEHLRARGRRRAIHRSLQRTAIEHTGRFESLHHESLHECVWRRGLGHDQKNPPMSVAAFARSIVAIGTAVSAVVGRARTKPRCASSTLSNATVAASALS